MTTTTDLIRPVYENVVEWHDTTHQFSMDDIGMRVRVWFDRTAKVPPARTDRMLLQKCMLNDIDPDLRKKWMDEAEPCDDVLEMAIAIADALRTVRLRTVNAVEVTVRGEGSIYYPVWP